MTPEDKQKFDDWLESLVPYNLTVSDPDAYAPGEVIVFAYPRCGHTQKAKVLSVDGNKLNVVRIY